MATFSVEDLTAALTAALTARDAAAAQQGIGNIDALTNALTAALTARDVVPAATGVDTEEPSRFRHEVRSAVEQKGIFQSISNSKRNTLKPVDKEKYRVNATTGLSDKFGLISVSGNLVDAVELLNENVVATKLITKVKDHCTTYGMHEVFTIVTPPTDAAAEVDDSLSKDLFDKYSTITKDEILKSTLFYRGYGQDYDLENLAWAETFLKNCCDKNLSDKLDERMDKYSALERGGPIFFYEMMQAILTLTTDSAALMKDKLRSLKMQDFLGEDVNKVVTLLRGTIKRLEMINDVPIDLPKQIIAIFRTCSVPEFTQIFTTISSLHTLGPLAGGKDYDSETLLEAAESAYVKLSTIWNVPDNTKTSTFITKNGITCWGCGENGHSLDQCPHKTASEKEAIHKEKKKQMQSLNSVQPDLNRELSYKEQIRIPPKAGEKQTKMIGTQERKWCEKCNKWTLTHGTSTHRSKSEIRNDKDTPAANTLTTPGTTTSEGGPRVSFADQISSQMRGSRE
jgi:hypothetical protein